MNSALVAFKALSDESRLRILRVLEAGSFNVGELCEVLDMGQSRTSRHLKILADAGLVTARRAGAWVYYARVRPAAASLRARVLEALADEPRDPTEHQRALEVVQRRAERTREFFERVAPDWEALRAQVHGTLDALPALRQRLGGQQVLVDLGTGNGDVLLELAGEVHQAIGVDRSARMLAEAERRRAERGSANVEFRLGALEHLPLADGEATAAVAHMVLCYLEDPPSALREAARTLAAGGTLQIVDLAEYDPATLPGEVEHRWPGLGTDELTRWLEDAGFTQVDIQTLSRTGPAPDLVLAAATRTERTEHP